MQEGNLSPENQEKLQELSSAQIADLRVAAQTDLFFLSKGVLGYNQVEEGAHAALCAFMVREKSNRRMVLMPRGHLKTTICTISDSIRLALCDANTRVLIMNEVFDNAADMLHELKQHWVNGVMLRSLFPELVPERFSGPGTDWSKDAASVKREANYKESTWTAAGSGGSPQSKHFKHIKNDDLIGEKAKESPTEMERALRWVDSMTPLLDRLDDTIDWYGTRKTMSDVYAHVEKKYKGRLKTFVRYPIENNVPIFSKMPMEELLRIMVETPEMWAHDYMNNPIGKGGLDWGQGLIRYYQMTADGGVRFQHHITGEIKHWTRRELDIVITVDPNSGKLLAPDKPAIVVHGCSPEEQIFVLETWSERVQPDALVEKAFELAVKWRPRVVGFEEAGQQNTKFYFEKKRLEEATFFGGTADLKHHNKDKETRIRKSLDTPLKQRRVYMLPTQLSLISAIQLFPQLPQHDWDEIDCFSYGPQLYAPGMAEKDLQDAEEAEAKILAMRGVTGYGNSCVRRAAS